MLAVTLPEELERRLERLAQRVGQTKSALVEAAVVEHIHDLEDAFIAEQRVATEGDVSERVPLSELLSRYADDVGSQQK